ncbi:Predicted membrane protein [Plasmopara halstedii]|uniref:Predicted membrane protein n=1 Tax=Plasmopara halstedii TaxID=4781 RepID=A0A0P1AV99_PLAHL|nr:Predicted membrane protein [Plasmopara halstedii]CEG44964.1 Predicted membrane protein [Plasmopara halstedii]|eukprot:XP_024581333.1 Predicted membrane protein [Plasmopara halstedii]
MANQAAKKAKRSSASLSTRLQQWIVPINVLYFVYCILWHSSLVTTWTYVGYFYLTFSTYFCYSWVVAAAEEGGNSEYAMDVLIITLFVQAGLMISSYFWLVYLVIPGYILYHVGRMLLNYVFTPDSTTENDPNMIRKKEKAERKAARPKFRR